jgi:hypothetical protein
MKYAVLLSALLLLSACNQNQSVEYSVEPAYKAAPITYDQLANYPLDCNKADEQLAHLRAIQSDYNFDSDPDMLSDVERSWNAIIKSNIWWFAYTCDKS